ncbi:hypothetical protein ACWIF2_39125, partial [Streptomyces sp. NPDC055506]
RGPSAPWRVTGPERAADTARQLDALIEGLTLHRALDTEPQSRELTRLAVTRLTTAEVRPPGV